MIGNGMENLFKNITKNILKLENLVVSLYNK
jgi:hypothetical protein